VTPTLSIDARLVPRGLVAVLALTLSVLAGCAMGVLPLRAAARATGAPGPSSGPASGPAGAPVAMGAAASPTAGALPPQVSASQAAGGVRVTGRRGRMGSAERTALLRQLGGEGQANALNRHLLAMGRFGKVDLYAHNQARLLVDGPSTFAAMFEAIERATQSVLVQSYIIEDAAISARLAELLVRKASQGVGVAVLYDDLGSIGKSSDFVDALHAANIPTCAYNPVSPFKRAGYWGITQRDHRKILSVDRSIGFTGGINISAVYASGSFGRARLRTPEDAARSGWRDTQVRLQGPAVVALDDVVRRTWAQQGCRGALPAPARPLAPPAAANDVVRIVVSGPTQAAESAGANPASDEGRIYAMLLDAVDAATRQIYITMAYFSPGEDMVEALADAARRGVDVRLVLPSLSDFSPVLHSGRSHYQRMLDAGVKLYELDDAVLHAKTAVIDGVVSTVGSSNMDWRSIAVNNEVNAVVLGEDFGSAMVAMFQRDLARSTPVDPAQWARRPFTQRAKEALARAFERLW